MTIQNLKRLPPAMTLIIAIVTLFLNLQAIATPSDEPLPLSIREASVIPKGGIGKIPRMLRVHIQLKPGFKAYQDKFHLQILEPYPTTSGDLNVAPIEEFYDKFSKTAKKGVKGSGTLEIPFDIQEPLEPGHHNLHFELQFQACSESVCYFPQKIQHQLEFDISGTHDLSSVAKKTDLGLLEESFESAQKRGLPYLFIFVFLAGILTSLTPCLLPMLPLTIAVIGKGHSHDQKVKKFFSALIYVLGIATTYSALGVAAASSGALFGNILTNLWVQVGFGCAFIFMGFAQFGFFEFQTPLSLQNRFHKLSSGAGGIYLTGLLSGFIASPCVGPVLVGILTFIARSQDRVLGFGLMFSYAFGIGQLLLILGVSSNLLYRFPKAPWIMKTSKTILGVALIASGLFYLSLLWPKPTEIKLGPVETRMEASPDSAQGDKQTLKWAAYSEEKMQEALQQKRPILIDFFADWCLACKELENRTFNDPKVVDALKNFALLRFDATNESETLSQLKTKYGIVGLPTLIFYNRNGHWDPTKNLNEFEDSEQFAERVRKLELDLTAP